MFQYTRAPPLPPLVLISQYWGGTGARWFGGIWNFARRDIFLTFSSIQFKLRCFIIKIHYSNICGKLLHISYLLGVQKVQQPLNISLRGCHFQTKHHPMFTVAFIHACCFCNLNTNNKSYNNQTLYLINLSSIKQRTVLVM